jgi:signal transduction histidine kinase/DNA-binding response OmpR family regulator
MIPLDYPLFVIVTLAAFLAVNLWLRRPERDGKIPNNAWIFVAAILVGGWFLVDAAGNHEKKRIQSMVEGFAPTYALEMARMGHARVGFETDAKDPLYLAMIDAEIQWLRVNPLVHDIYTFKMRPDGRIVLIVDSETDYDRNGVYEGERESRTPIGEAYDEADASLKRAFSGEAVFDSNPVTDRWGTWVSAYVPVFDDQGRVDAVLGVDYAARDWSAAIRRGRLAAIGFLSVLLGVFGASVGSIANLRSHIRRRQEIEAELVKAKQAAEAASVAKGEFLANMSHEIRTPLNGIIGMIDLLRDTELSLRQKEFLGVMRESSFDLSALLSDILDFSKIEAGRLGLESVPFSVRDTVEGALKPFLYRAQAKGLSLETHLAPSIPNFLMGDPGRFRQILSNLVGNALKFTERGGVAVEIVLESGDPDSTRLRITVADTGIGIPRHKQRSVFDIFTQSDSSITRRYGGTGLGLAIVSQLVRLMSGRIWVESEEGHGSRFHVTLALSHPSPEALRAAESAAPPAPEASSGLRILLAEDTAINQMVTWNVLKKRGHRVTVAANGREVLTLLDRQDFDLILMDVQMPELDGLETTRRIRAREKDTGRHIPIVAMTARALVNDRQMTLDAGMDDYLAKPIDGQKLLAAVDRWAAKRPSSSPGTWSPDDLAARLGGDREFLKKIAALFEEDRRRLQDEIRRAVRQRDAQALERAAHALRGSVGNFHDQEAFAEAAELEKMGREGRLDGTDGLIAKLETSLDRLSQLLQNL